MANECDELSINAHFNLAQNAMKVTHEQLANAYIELRKLNYDIIVTKLRDHSFNHRRILKINTFEKAITITQRILSWIYADLYQLILISIEEENSDEPNKMKEISTIEHLLFGLVIPRIKLPVNKYIHEGESLWN